MKKSCKAFLLVFLASLQMITFCSCKKDTKEGNETDMTSESESTTTSEAQTTVKEAPTVSSITAANKDFKTFVKLNGRVFYNERSQAYYFNYALGGFEISFRGTGVSANILTGLGNGGDEKNAILYVFVDGAEEPTSTLHLNEKNTWYTLAENLADGEHTLKVAKRTDISYSSAGIKEIKVEGGTLGYAPEAKKMKIEFLGDSITSGDGVLSNNGSGSYISEYQDAYYSYASVTAKHFDADCVLLSRCGLGLVWNSSQKAPEDGGVSLPMIYEYQNYYDDPKKNKWDFDSFVPDVIVINIGTNDRKQVTSSEASKTRWMNEYKSLLQTVRKHNPNAPIICCYGSMIDNVDLGLESVVNSMKDSGFKDLYYFRFPANDERKFGKGVGNHPTVKKQKYDAEEYLIPFIEQVLGK